MESEDKNSADVREGNPPVPAKNEEPKPPAESGAKAAEGETKANERSDAKKARKDRCSKKHAKGKSRKTKKAPSSPPESSSDSDSDDSADGTSSSTSSDDDQSEDEGSKKKRLVKKRQDPEKAKKKTRAKNQKKALRPRESSESDSDSDSSDGAGSSSSSSDEEGTQQNQAELLKQLQLLLLQQQQQQGGGSYGYPSGLNNSVPPPIYDNGLRVNPPRPRRGGARVPGRGNISLGGIDPNLRLDGKQQQKDRKKRLKATKLDYKRVDQVWDDAIHNYKLQDTAERTVDAQYDEFIFHVRRTFDWEGKYKATIVDIKSKLLRECLQDVIGDIKGISLVDDTPKLDPNMLFL